MELLLIEVMEYMQMPTTKILNVLIVILMELIKTIEIQYQFTIVMDMLLIDVL